MAAIESAQELLAAAGFEHEFIPTEPAGGTVAVVRKAIDEDGARRVIYMGGDGTFADVAKGVLASANRDDVVMGMLPTGTANDQGKSFGLSAGAAALKDNVAVIKAGITTKIDVGHIQILDAEDRVSHSDLFFDSASIGWGAAVLETRNRDRETVAQIPVVRSLYRDQLVYAGAMVRHLVKAVLPNAKFTLEAEVDGESHRFEGLIDVILKNTHVFGGEWVLAPDAEVDDGLFEMIPVTGTREFTSKMLATFRHSPIDEADLESVGISYSKPVPGSSFVLTILHPGEDAPAAQIDGEEFPAGDKYRIDVMRRALCIVVPREAAR